FAPPRANATLVALPTPLVAPVTTATLFVNSLIEISFPFQLAISLSSRVTVAAFVLGPPDFLCCVPSSRNVHHTQAAVRLPGSMRRARSLLIDLVLALGLSTHSKLRTRY